MTSGVVEFGARLRPAVQAPAQSRARKQAVDPERNRLLTRAALYPLKLHHRSYFNDCSNAS